MARGFIFENHQPYHILNRGVEGRTIFLDEIDYYRFLFLFHACNFGSPASNLWRKDIIRAGRAILAGKTIPPKVIQKEHPQLVDVLALILMPNHFHSILEQRIDNGISIFMQKLGNAYAKYFNARNQRRGRLFQGPFRAILIHNENYLLSLFRYVHLNVLDFIQPDWREKGVKDWQRAMNLLKEYPWSTAPDYLGVRNSKIVTTKSFYNKFFSNFSKEGIINLKKFFMGWSDKEAGKIRAHLLE